jgi:hypothetical protein
MGSLLIDYHSLVGTLINSVKVPTILDDLDALANNVIAFGSFKQDELLIQSRSNTFSWY